MFCGPINSYAVIVEIGHEKYYTVNNSNERYHLHVLFFLFFSTSHEYTESCREKGRAHFALHYSKPLCLQFSNVLFREDKFPRHSNQEGPCHDCVIMVWYLRFGSYYCDHRSCSTCVVLTMLCFISFRFPVFYVF